MFSMENVPDDVLIAIAAQLKRNASAAQDLLAFIKVSARWHALGIPLLYGNISISTRRIEPFAHGFVSSKYAKLVRSLSLCIGSEDSMLDEDPFRPTDLTDPWNEAESNESSHIGIDRWIARQNGLWMEEGVREGVTYETVDARLPFALFIPILPRLHNLVSFSLVIEGAVEWYMLRRTTITGLVNALPPSCINLELDTNGYDYMDDESIHVCETIRRILPRMRNVRLRLGAMCSALFGSGQSPVPIDAHKGSSSGSADWVTLKNIESLVVSCGTILGGELLLRCGYEDHANIIGSDSWCDITSSLNDLITKDAVGSRNTQILVMSPSWGHESTFTFETNLRTDMVNRETWAVPLIHKVEVRDSFPDYNLVRAPDGSEQVIKNYDQINDISEGHIWRSTACGARLPAYIVNAEKKGLASFATGCVERLAPNLMEQYYNYDDVRPGMSLTRTYRDEARTGVKLVLAEKRTGHDFLALRPVKVLTPDGWVRTGRDQNLERINIGLH
ncbi:hypothetical protein IQ07DRAFT_685784 [Pyrenochaeta sp. DS3sAY3a]|nr:hypothetical protein IQ07DRAFT_685784 [Pyrenochaeta sp. DS3sAY3a]